METKVEVVESTLVAPSEDTPRLGLWLSNFDVTAAMTHIALGLLLPGSGSGSNGGGRRGILLAGQP
jgi:shikimate O-hydroxycinnamoyltransferase